MVMGDNSHNRAKGFRRAARVVFLTGRPDGLAAEAAQFVQQLGQGWLEARAVALPACCLAGCTLPVVRAEDLAWGDLLVTLDAAALVGMPARRSAMQHRHYPFEPDADHRDAVLMRLRDRVAGMAGGMRLLQKAAQEAPDEAETE